MLVLGNTHESRASDIADMLIGQGEEYLLQLLSTLPEVISKADECERILEPVPMDSVRAAGPGAGIAAGGSRGGDYAAEGGRQPGVPRGAVRGAIL